MLKSISNLQGVQKLSKQQQQKTIGGSVCCFNSADHHMQDIPHYADPSADGYLSHGQRHAIWLSFYDGCVAGLDPVCAPVQ